MVVIDLPCPFRAWIRRSAASARSARARLLSARQCFRNSLSAPNRSTDLVACFLNPAPAFLSSSFSMSAFSARPPPAKAPAAVTRVPALRFLAVCAPVRVEGPGAAACRRRGREVGRARLCAPPHYSRQICKKAQKWGETRREGRGA